MNWMIHSSTFVSSFAPDCIRQTSAMHIPSSSAVANTKHLYINDFTVMSTADKKTSVRRMTCIAGVQPHNAMHMSCPQ